MVNAVLALVVAVSAFLVTTTSATVQLNEKTFADTLASGKNGMVKFFQEWCGHCKRMKPDWDKLATEAHPSVFIADVDCGQEKELCEQNNVSGYPTIKYWVDGEEKDYKGGRSFEELNQFVDDNLATKCVLGEEESSCTEKALAYADKWKAKEAAEISKEYDRLKGMMGSTMKGDLKKWIRERVNVLEQLKGGNEEL